MKFFEDNCLFPLAVFLLVGLIFFGCAPRECGGTYYVPQECKDYGYFLKGSYWVYQNDSTLQLDSFSVVFDSTFWTHSPDLSEGCNEETGPSGGSSFDGEQINSLATSSISEDSIQYSSYSSEVYFYMNGNRLGQYLIPSVRDYPNVDQWDLFDAIAINGNLYLDVYKTTSTYTGATLYFQKNIGVIKFQLPIDTTDYVESWSILRYHTIQ
ncbi:MAG TPA: hypothetical protein VE978_18435 [Chitinophagales bacterium]|nr:hypothetical protein [Chitinophagales bacterium]